MNFQEEFTLAPADWLVITRPVALKPIALHGRKWFIGAAAGLLFALFLFEPATEGIFKKIYGSSRAGNGGFFDGLKNVFKNSSGPPPWKVNQERWQYVFYFASAVAAAGGLWRAVGPVAAEARRKAAAQEENGRSLIAAGKLSEALAALEESSRWMPDPNRRRTIVETASQVRARVAAQTAGLAPMASAQATVAAGAGYPAPPDQTVAIAGPDQTVAIAGNKPGVAGGPFELRRLLGRGGMGEVHEAHDSVLDRVVAFKKLPAQLAADVQFVMRFTQEARALAKLSHPNVVQVYDIIRDPQGIYIALEYVSGGDLVGLIEREKTLAPARAVALAKEAAQGLAFAHSQGIVHRDIKPHNILLTTDGRPKLTDFGLAKVSGSAQMTVDGAILGSPAYMSPEQAEGKTADMRSDVYSFGVMLYHMIAGRPPFDGGTQEVLLQHLTKSVPPIAGAPAAVNDFIAKCTARKPDDRYADGAALVAALSTMTVA